MPKESGLGNLSSIQNSDFFRMVTAAGLSKNATGELVKAFIGADTITKVNDYYYYQDAENPVDNDYRTFSNGIYLDFERYETDTWVRQFRIGGSAFVNRFIEISKEVNADILVSDGDELRNLVRAASFSDGTVVADIGGNTFVSTLDKLIKVKPTESFSWKVVQSDDTLNSIGISFYVDNTTTPSIDGFISKKIKVSGVSLPAGVTAQLKIFLQSDLVNPIWENVTDIEFGNGLGAPLDESTGELVLKPSFYATGNTAVRLMVNFSEEITLKGGDITASDIYFESYDVTVNFNDTANYPFWKEKTYAKGGKIWQDDDIYICNTAGAQITSFAANETEWDVLGLKAYGELYVYGNTIGQTLGNKDIWTQSTVFDTVGEYAETIPSDTNDEIKISKKGVYSIKASIAFSDGVAQSFELMLKKNNGVTDFQNIVTERKMGASNDIGSVSLSGFADLSIDDTIELWIRGLTSNGQTIVIKHANLSAVKI